MYNDPMEWIIEQGKGIKVKNALMFDKRTFEQKLEDLSFDNLLDNMLSGFERESRILDQYQVYSKAWRWNKWLRAN